MHKILLSALSLLMCLLIGKANWDQTRCVVLRLINSSLPGGTKRVLALSRLRDDGMTLSPKMLNLAIEAAVIWASQKHSP